MRLPPLLLAALLLAGCSADPAPEPAVTAGPSVITDPTQGLNDTGAHIHNYWQGQDRLVIIGPDAPADESGLGPGFSSGAELAVRMFQPSSGHVVPQGTSSVEVTFSWTDASDGLDLYGEAAAYVKTAGTNQSELLGPTTNGQTLVLETGLPDADLPHQLLSGWAFELRLAPDPDTGILRYKGVVAVTVEAVRGLELPVFPAHPDAWNGSTEIPLVDAEGQLSYWEDTGDGGANGMSGPVIFTPASGAIVPANASHVAVTLTWTGPIAIELWYHDATARAMVLATPTSTGAGTASYELSVSEGPDGPYATQSQWEFTVRPAATGPLRTAWTADYTLAATAVR